MAVCIIGSGTAGLCAAVNILKINVVPTIFEQTSSISGTWTYTPKTTNIETKSEVHTSMYEGLRTNLPKEVMGFPNYTILNAKESYVPSDTIQNFLEEYAEHFGLRKYMRMCCKVLRVHPKNNKWEVTIINMQNNACEVYLYDYVINCNGHYHTPLYPNLEGKGIYSGEQKHSHDFRNVDEFRNKSVLIVGAGPSGMDLCHKISEVALQTFLSHKMNDDELKTKFLPNVVLKKRVVELKKFGGIFEDNSYEHFDCIVYCTGFKYSFPYINMDCKSYVKNNYVRYLYKDCINTYYPTMSFIGLPYYVCFAQMVDSQAKLVNKFINKTIQLPSIRDTEDIRKKEMKMKKINGFGKHQAHMLGPLQDAYFTDLNKTSQSKYIPNVYTKLHNESSQQFMDDLLSFRNEEFKIIDDHTFIKTN